MALKAVWKDSGREPQCSPDPEFPHGIDADVSEGAVKTCSLDLPYPAKRCGIFVVQCDECGQVTALTTAGRPDDPRRVTLGCYSQQLNPNPPGMTKVVFGGDALRRTPSKQ